MKKHPKKIELTDIGVPDGYDLGSIVDVLSDPSSYSEVFHRANHDVPMPSIERLGEIVDLLKSVLFPGYFGQSEMKPDTIKYYIGSTLDRVFPLLVKQIQRGVFHALTRLSGHRLRGGVGSRPEYFCRKYLEFGRCSLSTHMLHSGETLPQKVSVKPFFPIPA